MPKRSLGWGIIGSTGWSDHTFGPAVFGATNASLVAVLSRDQSTADAYCEKHEVPKGYVDLDAFLADPAVEAVWVTGPNHLHAPHSIAALKAGKHVLCEKPMALNVPECEAMIAAAHDAGRQLSVGYHLRHHPLHQELQHEWISGAFGDPIFFRAQLYYAYPQAPGEWRQKRATSGGWAISDIGTHLIDLCRWFLGDVEGVSGQLTNRRFGFETDDHALIMMRCKNGASAITDASTGAGGPARIELYGSEGYAIAENTYFGHGGLISRGKGNDKPTVSGGHNVNPYRNQVEAFSRAVLEDAPLLVTAIDGLENLRIMQVARGYQ